MADEAPLDNTEKAKRVAEIAQMIIEFDTDPATAELSDPNGPPDWNRGLDAVASGLIDPEAYPGFHGIQAEKTTRAYVDQCFEWHYGQTPAEFAEQCIREHKMIQDGNAQFSSGASKQPDNSKSNGRKR